MKKIIWIRRIFWSWEKLKEYFLKSKEDDNKNVYIDLNENLKKNVAELREDKERLKIELEQKNKELLTLKTRSEEKEKNMSKKNQEVVSLQNKMSELRTKLTQKSKEQDNLQFNIYDKLETLGKIEKTFFAKSGNKGKGELGEMQVKSILEKSDLPQKFWTENLLVGTKVVEFAIKSGEKGKWIPVDSKVIESELDENNKILIDKKYLSKVKEQAKEIQKYLDKSNTASYGVLVLQSDSIYTILFEQFPNFFQSILNDFKIYIASPSSFVQMSWSISQIVEVYDKVKNDKIIYDDMISTLDSVANFAKKLNQTQVSFNIAMDKHFPIIQKKHTNLIKILDTQGKWTKKIEAIDKK